MAEREIFWLNAQQI